MKHCLNNCRILFAFTAFSIFAIKAHAETANLVPMTLTDLSAGIQSKGNFVIDSQNGGEARLVNLSGVIDGAGEGAFATVPLLDKIPSQGFLTIEFDFLPTKSGSVQVGFSRQDQFPGPMVGWLYDRGLIVRQSSEGAFAFTDALDPLGEKLTKLNPTQWYRLRSVWNLNESGRMATLEICEVGQPASEFKKLAFDAAQTVHSAPLGLYGQKPSTIPSSWTHCLLRVQNGFKEESVDYPEQCSAAIRNLKVTWSE